MSNEHLNLAFNAPLLGAKKSVLIALADRCNHAGYCYPAIDDIAYRAGCTRRTVMSAIKELENDGYLVAIRDNGRVNKYIFTLDKLSTTSETISHEKVIHTSEIDDQTSETISPTSETISPKPPLTHLTLKTRAQENHHGKNKSDWRKAKPTSKTQPPKFQQPEEKPAERPRNMATANSGFRDIRAVLSGVGIGVSS